jgi:hypothetical protein
MSNIIGYAYNAFCDGRFPLPTEEDVAALEQRIRAPFPYGYRNYLLEYNGGIFSEPEIAPPSPDCPADRLTFLSGIRATLDCAELANPGDLSLFTDNDPLEVLPIGYTMMGNLLAMSMRGDAVGVILMKKAFSDRWFVLADGIEEFFSLLTEPTND